MRRKFGHLINKIAEKDKKVVLLVGDNTEYLMSLEKLPKRFFNMYVILIGVASGMALEGLKPWLIQ